MCTGKKYKHGKYVSNIFYDNENIVSVEGFAQFEIILCYFNNEILHN